MSGRLLITGATGSSDLGGVLYAGLWVMVAAVLAVAGLRAALALREWARREQRAEPFTLQDLRELRARQQISEAEFQALRAAVLGRGEPPSAGASAEGRAAAPPDGPPPPAE